MRKITVAASVLAVLLAIGYVNPHWFSTVWAEAGGKSWGTPMSFSEYMIVSNGQEIEKTHYANVFQKVAGNKVIDATEWENLLRGDMSSIKNEIEHGIPGSRVVYLLLSWDKATKGLMQTYIVEGFFVQALVYNENAGLTGLEIAAIILIISFLAAVVGLLAIGGWVTFNVISAAQQIGPWMTILIGVGILAGVGLLLFVVFGGKFNYKGKKRSFNLGGNPAETLLGRKNIFLMRN